MFGHQNNDQDQSATDYNPTPNGAQPVAPTSEPFNPALPNPAMGYGEVTTPPTDTPQPDAPQADDHSTPVQFDEPSTSAPMLSSATNDLLDIKQQALNQLSPLVDHLEQSPEEKFRTTMMMIQATDNQDLVKDAYAAAQAIPDEKAKAQALLDIVNEINYFTQHHQA